MQHVSIKNWFHHMHPPVRNDTAIKADRMILKYWIPLVILITFLTLLAIAWWNNV